ncbi:MAG: hypothetical protein K8H74_17900 [Notoacmeibacter sp.]|nr:hypothetical protein [Notoacmeibacter sp.]
MKAQERLWLTADRKRLVPDGHSDAAFLYAAPGDEIPASAAEMFGLVDGNAPSKHAGRASRDEDGKSRKDGEDKRRKDGEDKSFETPASPAPQDEGDDLTAIKGIGPATAARLAEAGITSFAALSAFEFADPRFASLGVKAHDLKRWIDQAKTLADRGSADNRGGLTINTSPTGD